ncbi:hypothetical protein Tco_0496530 [Tanacetum coccineum]
MMRSLSYSKGKTRSTMKCSVDLKLLKWLLKWLKKLIKTPMSLNIKESIPLPLQDPSIPKPSQKKRKAMALEHETFIVGIHCNKLVPEGVKFKENKVIEMIAYPNDSHENQNFVKLMNEMIAQRSDKHILLTLKAKLELMGFKEE